MAFLTNLLLFSPLLALAAAILFLLERADTLRKGAGLEPAPAPSEPAEEDPSLPGEEDELEADDDDDVGDGEVEEEEEEEEEEDEEPEPAAGEPGPSTPRIPRIRNVGTKKARSLARRDVRRAHFEFMRSQAQQRAETEAAQAEEDAAMAFENARRRALVEEGIVARRELERRERREKEEKRERKDVTCILRKAKAGERFKLGEVREREWEEAVLRREGYVGARPGGVGILTGRGEWVWVREKDLVVLWENVRESGGVVWKEMGRTLEELMRR